LRQSSRNRGLRGRQQHRAAHAAETARHPRAVVRLAPSPLPPGPGPQGRRTSERRHVLGFLLLLPGFIGSGGGPADFLRLRTADEMNRSIVQRFSSGVLWTVVGNVAAKVFTAASAILLARILGPKGFGEYGLVLSTVLLFS